MLAASLWEMPDAFAGFRCYPHREMVESSADTGLLRAVRRFTPASQAPALLRLAADILGVDSSSPGHRDEILRLCRALANEGGMVQEMAEEIARELTRR